MFLSWISHPFSLSLTLFSLNKMISMPQSRSCQIKHNRRQLFVWCINSSPWKWLRSKCMACWTIKTLRMCTFLMTLYKVVFFSNRYMRIFQYGTLLSTVSLSLFLPLMSDIYVELVFSICGIVALPNSYGVGWSRSSMTKSLSKSVGLRRRVRRMYYLDSCIFVQVLGIMLY